MGKPTTEPRPGVVQFTTWNQTLVALKEVFTISFRDACRLLRASRSWVNDYIKPNVPYIYLSSGLRGEKISGINWVSVAASELGRDMSESVWFNSEKLAAFLTDHIVSCTKQTKRIPFTGMMNPEMALLFMEKRQEIRKELATEKNVKERAKLFMEYSELPQKFVKQDEATKLLIQNCLSVTERSKVEPISVPFRPEYIGTWTAPHDLKDYGDSDEQIYRWLFRTGHIRIELQFTKGEKVGKKIFYAPDPEALCPEGDNEGAWIVAETAWQRYLASQLQEQ